MSTRTLIVLLSCAVLAACGDDGASLPDAPLVDALAPDAAPREIVMSTQSLVPGEIVELILTGGPGDVAVLELSAPLPAIGWNLHGHAAGGTQVIFEEFDKMTVDYTFVPPAVADWYLLVRNQGQVNLEVEVKVGIYGTMTWRWQ